MCAIVASRAFRSAYFLVQSHLSCDRCPRIKRRAPERLAFSHLLPNFFLHLPLLKTFNIIIIKIEMATPLTQRSQPSAKSKSQKSPRSIRETVGSIAPPPSHREGYIEVYRLDPPCDRCVRAERVCHTAKAKSAKCFHCQRVRVRCENGSGERVQRLWLDEADYGVYPDEAFDTDASETDLPDNISSLASEKKVRCREWNSGGKIFLFFFFILVRILMISLLR